MGKNRHIVTCERCGRLRPHYGRGYCQTCWRIWRQGGAAPAKRRYHLADFASEYTTLVLNHPHVTNYDIAAAMGMTFSGVSRAAARARRAGLLTIMRRPAGRHGAAISHRLTPHNIPHQPEPEQPGKE